MLGTEQKVDYGLLRRWSNQILCSRCFKRGQRTPVAQIISARHRLLSLCGSCGDKSANAIVRPLAEARYRRLTGLA